MPLDNHITLRTLRKWAQEKHPFAMLTCYDATTASWLWRGGVKTLLVGDTAAQVILGHDSTLPATMRFMVEITAAVRRGAPEAFVMADMPFGSYQAGEDAAVRHAMQFLSQGNADAVKFEVDETFCPLVERLNAAGVPVVAHVGSRPQRVRRTGGYGSAGRTAKDAKKIVDTAVAMVDHGAAMVLIEAVPAEVSARIVKALSKRGPRSTPVPVIGCGAGPACHGHVIVLHDLLGLTPWHPPFAKPMANLGEQMQDAAARWVDLVASGKYLKDDHPYKMER